jgi:hypothetical protein
MELDSERLLPIPTPSSSMLDFRGYFCGATTGRVGVFDPQARWCTAEELAYHEEMRKHDGVPPWEKSLVFSNQGLSQRAISCMDRFSGHEL